MAFATLEIVYVTPLDPEQAVVPVGLPCVMVPGVEGIGVTVNAAFGEVVVEQGPLLFSVTTQSNPLAAATASAELTLLIVNVADVAPL